MGLRRFCKRVLRVCRPKTRRKPRKRPKRPQHKHKADTPPANGSCLLLALPTEIRLRILEYVLLQKNPIQARENIKSKDPLNGSYYPYNEFSEWDEWPCYKPDLGILRTCRQLQIEGTSIFYQKNTFGITVYDPGYGQPSEVDVIGLGPIASAFARLPRLKECPKFKITFVLADVVYCQTLGMTAWKDAIDKPIEELQQRWRRCERLDVEVIQRNRLWTNDKTGSAALFHKLGLLRCKAVWFRGVPYSISCPLTDLIESDRPVFDLQKSFRELTSFVESTWMRDSPAASLDEQWQELERAAIEYDETTFMKIRRQVIELAHTRMITSVQRLVETGNELMDKAIAGPDELVETDVEALLASLQF